MALSLETDDPHGTVRRAMAVLFAFVFINGQQAHQTPPLFADSSAAQGYVIVRSMARGKQQTG
jgi:hypothetical protein